MKQLDENLSETGRQSGMADAVAGTPAGWTQQAIDLIRQLALHHPFLCADDLWAAGLQPPPEARALGPVFVRARSIGILKATPMFILTTQVERHRAPIRVWRSQLYQPEFAVSFDEALLPSRQPPKVSA